MGAWGDAGAVVTNEAHVALAVRKLRDHGGVEKYQHDLVGYNSRLDTLQAAVLLAKLRYLDEWTRLRQAHARLYTELLSHIPGIIPPVVLAGATHVYHLYVIRVEQSSREALQQYLRESGVQTGIHYPQPIPFVQAFSHLRESRFPIAEASAQQVLSLPLYPELERSQIEYVAERIYSHLKMHT